MEPAESEPGLGGSVTERAERHYSPSNAESAVGIADKRVYKQMTLEVDRG